MTLTSDLNAISSVQVDDGTAYPVIASRITTRYEGPAGQDTAAYRVERWELTCHAFAADTASVATLSETIRDDLCGRGREVDLIEFGGTRTLSASNSLAGYPTVELADVPDGCFGNVLKFTLTCDARIPQPDEGSLVEHDWERTEETDAEGDVSITQRGTYRVANGGDAKADAKTAFIDAVETAAGVANQTFRIRWTLGPDAAVAEYEYTVADKEYSGGGSGVDEAQLTDRTIVNNVGRIVRTLSGHATGTGAQAWIDSQAPTPDSTNILTRKESSPASIPDGRVNFAFELLTGVSDAQFPNVTVFGFSESISQAEQVEELIAATYLGRDAQLRYGVKQPTVYVQTTRMEFLGTWANGIIAVTGLFDDDNLVTTPRRRLSSGPHGLKTIEYTATYMYETPLLTKPEPREIEAIS